MTSRKERRDKDKREPAASAPRSPALTLPPWALRLAVALTLAATVAYLPAFSAPFVMDDHDTIGASATWQTLGGSPTAGRPLVMATLATNFALNRAYGVDQRPDPDGPHKAVGYRVFNLLLHLLTGLLLFGVIRRAMRERVIPEDWRAIADPVATVVCALWLLHPIQSEVINYIVQRSEALASLFYLATLYASIRAWDAAASVRMRWYALALAACLLGMLSKEIVITAPLAVMLYDRAFRLSSWRALLRPGDGREWLYVALWAVALGSFATVGAGARGETAGLSGDISWSAYLYTQCWAIAHYLRLVVWPSPLAIDYGFNPIHGSRGIPGAALLVLLGLATIVAWTRVARFGWLAFAGSFFFLLLAPSSSIVPIASEVAAERRIYLALAALLLVVVVTAEWLRRRFAPAMNPRRLLSAVAIVCVVLTLVTAARSRAYNSNESLWRSSVAAVPENSRALGNLGWALYKSPVSQLAEAESMYVRAMRVDTTCHFGCMQYAAVLAHEGKLTEAEPLLQRELAEARGPSAILAERALGLVLMKAGQYARAVPHLETVAQQFPQMDHLVVLGVAYLSAGRRDEANLAFRAVSAVDGGSPEMQKLSARLDEAMRRPESLPELQQFAWTLSKDWM
jgi:protein O-mannosyl-transferase